MPERVKAAPRVKDVHRIVVVLTVIRTGGVGLGVPGLQVNVARKDEDVGRQRVEGCRKDWLRRGTLNRSEGLKKDSKRKKEKGEKKIKRRREGKSGKEEGRERGKEKGQGTK